MLYGLALRQGYKSCEVGAIKELVDMRRLVSSACVWIGMHDIHPSHKYASSMLHV